MLQLWLMQSIAHLFLFLWHLLSGKIHGIDFITARLPLVSLSIRFAVAHFLK